MAMQAPQGDQSRHCKPSNNSVNHDMPLPTTALWNGNLLRLMGRAQELGRRLQAEGQCLDR